MKLLLCGTCGDLFNLTFILKQCSCGATKGLYVDRVNAQVNGHGTSIAIGNGSLLNAMRAARIPAESREEAITKNRISHAWVRSHEGPDNPHTTINSEL